MSRWWPWGAGVAALALTAAGVVATGDRPVPGPACGTPAGRAVSDLAVFRSWLEEHRVRGVIGEVGWPTSSTRAWEPVASPWLRSAVDGGLGVYVWGAAEQWEPGYPLAVYRRSPDGSLVSGTQAELVETALPAAAQGVASLRGVALSGPSFGTDLHDGPAPYSSARPGVRGVDYVYPSRGFLAQLSERGITSVRLAVMWERLQAEPFGPLVSSELGELRRVLRESHQLGMSVVIDLHNYGRYAAGSAAGGRTVLRVGSAGLSASSLADLWRRIALGLRGSPGLAAYGLMNEPHDLPGGATRWEATTREVVAAVRKVDPTTLVLVPGYGWSATVSWRRLHPVPWVQEPGVAYEAHQYFDLDRTGTYARPIDEEDVLAAGAPCPSADPR